MELRFCALFSCGQSCPDDARQPRDDEQPGPSPNGSKEIYGEHHETSRHGAVEHSQGAKGECEHGCDPRTFSSWLDEIHRRESGLRCGSGRVHLRNRRGCLGCRHRQSRTAGKAKRGVVVRSRAAPFTKGHFAYLEDAPRVYRPSAFVRESCWRVVGGSIRGFDTLDKLWPH